MDATEKMQYRRIRNGWGLVVALVWIAYRWIVLSGQHAAAVAGLDHCSGFWHGIGCSMSKGAADSNYAWGVLLAILVAPLALIPAHYFARWRVGQAATAAADEQAKQDASRLEIQREESRQRLAIVEQDAQQAHQQVDRSDFIHTLGAVSDFLDLLATEQDPLRIVNIRLGATQSLRDLVAKHTIDQLAALIRADSAVSVSVTAILSRLSADCFDGAAEVHILRTAMREADAMASS